MSLLASIKPFWPLLFTFVLPRALGYLRALKTAYRTRPPPKNLPRGVDKSLNILFCAIVFFLVQSFKQGQGRDLQNVFSTTNTRLGAPLDVVFSRLALMRSGGILTTADESLRGALMSKEARNIYLTYGPSTLLDCTFCHPSQPQTYMLYHLPVNVLFPHLLHLTVLGLATSAGLTSPLTSKSRTRFLLAAGVFLAIDLYANTLLRLNAGYINNQRPSPPSLYAMLRVMRPLSFCFLDALFAFYLWATTTGRFVFFPFLSDPNAASSDVSTLQMQAQEIVRDTSGTLQQAQTKLRAFAIARNAVLRDQSLSAAEQAYWREVTRREGQVLTADGSSLDINDEIYQEEEVQAAIARVYGGGGIDVPRARREANAFVDGITQGLQDPAS